MASPTILIVDDEESVRVGLGHALRGAGYRLLFAPGPHAALQLLASESVDVVISDHLMPEMTGLDFLAVVRDRHPDTVRVMLTGHADADTAIQAINRDEVYRFLHKPCERDELRVTVHLALERRELERENRLLLALIRTSPDLERQLEAARARQPPP